MASDASASELWLSGSVRKDGARDLLSGMISGFFCKILEYPFDTIKVLEQTGGAKYSGPLDAARKTIAESGVWSLYNGLTAPLLGSMAECASLFVAYGVLKNALCVDEEAATLADDVPMWKYVVAGGGSGCASTCVLTPVELVKCRLQAQLGHIGCTSLVSGCSHIGRVAASYPSGCSLRRAGCSMRHLGSQPGTSRRQVQLGAPAPAPGSPPLFTGPIDVIVRTVLEYSQTALRGSSRQP